MAFEPKTDREHIIQLDGKIDKLDSKIDIVCESINRIALAFEKLETIKITDHETRLKELEKKENERGGAYKLFGLLITILGVIVAFLTIKTFI